MTGAIVVLRTGGGPVRMRALSVTATQWGMYLWAVALDGTWEAFAPEDAFVIPDREMGGKREPGDAKPNVPEADARPA